MSAAESTLSAQFLHPVVNPGTVQFIGSKRDVGKNIFMLEETVKHTDQALLNYCEYTPYFGGSVERFADHVKVIVHTD